MKQIDNDLDLMVVGSTIARSASSIGMLTETRYIGREDTRLPVDYEATKRAIESLLLDLRVAHRYVCLRTASKPDAIWVARQGEEK